MNKIKTIVTLFILAQVLNSKQLHTIQYCPDAQVQVECPQTLVADPVCAIGQTFVETFSNDCFACQEKNILGYFSGECSPKNKYFCEEENVQENCDETEIFGGVLGCYFDEDESEICQEGLNPCQICFESDFQIEYFYLGAIYDPDAGEIPSEEPCEPPADLILCERKYDKEGNIIKEDKVCTEQFDPVCAYDEATGSFVQKSNNCYACLDIGILGYLDEPCKSIPTEPLPDDVVYCKIDEDGNYTAGFECEEGSEEVCAYSLTGAAPTDIPNACEACLEQFYGYTYGPCSNITPPPPTLLPDDLVKCDIDEDGNFYTAFDCDESSEQVCAFDSKTFARIDYSNACEACSEQFSMYSYGPCQNTPHPEVPEDVECLQDANGNLYSTVDCDDFSEPVCVFDQATSTFIELPNSCVACEEQYFTFTYGPCKENEPEPYNIPRGFTKCENQYDKEGNFIPVECFEIYEPACAYDGKYFIDVSNKCFACATEGYIAYAKGLCENYDLPVVDPKPSEPLPEDMIDCNRQYDEAGNILIDFDCSIDLPVCAFSEAGASPTEMGNACDACYEEIYVGFVYGTCEDYSKPPVSEGYIPCDKWDDIEGEGEYAACPEYYSAVCALYQGEHQTFDNDCFACSYQEVSEYINMSCQDYFSKQEQELNDDFNEEEEEQNELPQIDEAYFQYCSDFTKPSEDDEEGVLCPDVYEPVCAFNGQKYEEFSNSCNACGGKISKFLSGPCENWMDTQKKNDYDEGGPVQPQNKNEFERCSTSVNEIPFRSENQACDAVYQPVCGQSENGNHHSTYGNSCEACNEQIVGYFEGECGKVEIKKAYCPTYANLLNKDCPTEIDNNGKGIVGCYIDNSGNEVCDIKANNFCDLCYGNRNKAAEYYYINEKSGFGQLLSFTATLFMVVCSLLF